MSSSISDSDSESVEFSADKDETDVQDWTMNLPDALVCKASEHVRKLASNSDGTWTVTVPRPYSVTKVWDRLSAAVEDGSLGALSAAASRHGFVLFQLPDEVFKQADLDDGSTTAEIIIKTTREMHDFVRLNLIKMTEIKNTSWLEGRVTSVDGRLLWERFKEDSRISKEPGEQAAVLAVLPRTISSAMQACVFSPSWLKADLPTDHGYWMVFVERREEYWDALWREVGGAVVRGELGLVYLSSSTARPCVLAWKEDHVAMFLRTAKGNAEEAGRKMLSIPVVHELCPIIRYKLREDQQKGLYRVFGHQGRISKMEMRWNDGDVKVSYHY